MNRLVLIVALALLLPVAEAKAQWSFFGGIAHPGTSWGSVSYWGNPSFNISFGRSWNTPWCNLRPWNRSIWWNSGNNWWGGSGNYWFTSSPWTSSRSARRLPRNFGSAPTVPNPVQILPTNWQSN